ncbi:hypothetical protein GCM10010327_66110 [Streptomyces nitrosporeus]|nr:hypothetical protein GCM10010327_66110 [Streptomyces nitrosporeus]
MLRGGLRPAGHRGADRRREPRRPGPSRGRGWFRPGRGRGRFRPRRVPWFRPGRGPWPPEPDHAALPVVRTHGGPPADTFRFWNNVWILAPPDGVWDTLGGQ